ncbi:Hpt domain-containing protein [Acanthopleuribacter pedis]|uniref:Hpt domain-containing protein n=1 Tax=Acanthopleuribacter pedis TaxID=442870 RepID=A0A8J7U3N7_9BACT|nr:Hpt domain-containing protein [Acanthopleuribacter pedis]MBO1319802.1 Hpt domain-containing protein [Acanthopleuribacter pedis]
MASLVDFSRIRETSDGDTEFEQELIEMYLEDAQLHVEDIIAKAAATDFGGIKSTAHTLKGASANIGAVAMQEAALNVEKSASSNDSDTLQDQVREIRTVFSETDAVFKNYLKDL